MKAKRAKEKIAFGLIPCLFLCVACSRTEQVFLCHVVLEDCEGVKIEKSFQTVERGKEVSFALAVSHGAH